MSGTSLVIGKHSGTGIAVSVGTSVVYFNVGGFVTYTEVRKFYIQKLYKFVWVNEAGKQSSSQFNLIKALFSIFLEALYKNISSEMDLRSAVQSEIYCSRRYDLL